MARTMTAEREKNIRAGMMGRGGRGAIEKELDAEREVSRKLAEALRQIDEWLLDTHNPLGDTNLLNQSFVKSYKLAKGALALYHGAK